MRKFYADYRVTREVFFMWKKKWPIEQREGTILFYRLIFLLKIEEIFY